MIVNTETEAVWLVKLSLLNNLPLKASGNHVIITFLLAILVSYQILVPYSGKFSPEVNFRLFRHPSQVAKFKVA